MSRGPDAGSLVRRAIERDARHARGAVTVALDESTRWASATFVGARHRLTLAGDDSDAFTRWLERLGEADLPIRGQLVADLCVVSVVHHAGRATASVEALTVET